MAEKIEKVSFKLSYGDKQGSYTKSGLKENASDEAIFDTAYGFSVLQAKETEQIFKIVEFGLEE